MKFSIKDFFSKYDQIRIIPQILSHLLKKSLMEKFIFCAVTPVKFPIRSFILNRWSVPTENKEQHYK